MGKVWNGKGSSKQQVQFYNNSRAEYSFSGIFFQFPFFSLLLSLKMMKVHSCKHSLTSLQGLGDPEL